MKLASAHERCPATGKHKQHLVMVDGKQTLVDVLLAPLVSDLSKLEIYTVASCQAGCGNACERKHTLFKTTREWDVVSRKYIDVWHYKVPKLCKESCWLVFRRAQDAENFLVLVYGKDEKLNEHMLGHGRKQSYAWSWCVTFDDDGRSIVSYYHLVFPRAHLAMVTARIHDIVVNEERYDKKEK
jgi:hypothetical protein